MIRQAISTDAYTIAQLAIKMWMSHTADELLPELNSLIADDDAVIYICTADEKVIGFAQCQLRHDYVEGTDSSPIGYLEGVFIEKGYRNRGYGKRLVHACEQWARGKGCTEFASDCELTNRQSHDFHLHSGFREVNRIVCFVKNIS